MSPRDQLRNAPHQEAPVSPDVTPTHPDHVSETVGQQLSGSPAESDAKKFNQDILDNITKFSPDGGDMKTYKHAYIKAMQQALKDHGLYHGTIDGVAGNHTKEAFLAYRSKSQPATKPASITSPTVAPAGNTTTAPIRPEQAPGPSLQSHSMELTAPSTVTPELRVGPQTGWVQAQPGAPTQLYIRPDTPGVTNTHGGTTIVGPGGHVSGVTTTGPGAHTTIGGIAS